MIYITSNFYFPFPGLKNVRLGAQFRGANTQNKEQGDESFETDRIFKFGHVVYMVLRTVLGKFFVLPVVRKCLLKSWFSSLQGTKAK